MRGQCLTPQKEGYEYKASSEVKEGDVDYGYDIDEESLSEYSAHSEPPTTIVNTDRDKLELHIRNMHEFLLHQATTPK